MTPKAKPTHNIQMGKSSGRGCRMEVLDIRGWSRWRISLKISTVALKHSPCIKSQNDLNVRQRLSELRL